MKHVSLSLALVLATACAQAPMRPTSFTSQKQGGGDANPDNTKDLPGDEENMPVEKDSEEKDGNEEIPSKPVEPSKPDTVVSDKPTTGTPTPTPTPKPTPTPTPTPTTPTLPAISAALSADLMARASQSTKVSNTKMGRWFQSAVDRRATDAEMKFLADANQNVAIPADKNWVYKKFDVKLYPSGGKPHPADGYQTAIGDCNMLAMFNAFAYQHPDFLKSLIKDKGNGTFEILMFNPQGERITVAVNSEFISDRNGQLAAVRGVNNTAVWISVMEKAIMKYNQVFKIWNGDGPAKVEGFGSEAGAPMLTGEGNSYAFDRGALKSKEDLTRVVKEALAAGKLITGGFGVPMVMNGLKSVTGHAYTVMVPANNKTMISMRNPWGVSPKEDGGSDTSHDGILDIAYDDAWFKTIDLRVMEPGISGTTGNTGPYQPRFNIVEAGFTADDMAYQLEMHRLYGSR